jgi:cytochrome c553
MSMVRLRVAIGLVSVLAMTACGGQSASGSASSTTDQQALVARGRTLVTVGGCNDCHTPKKMGAAGPEPDMSRMLSGHPESEAIQSPYKPADGTPWVVAASGDLTAWSGPWGISFTANLTPDTLTGLRSGVWTEDLFIQAMRSGKHVGTARAILPPMPWQEIGQLSDDDLRAIWAYLGSVPAVVNHVPDPVPPAQ